MPEEYSDTRWQAKTDEDFAQDKNLGYKAK